MSAWRRSMMALRAWGWLALLQASCALGYAQSGPALSLHRPGREPDVFHDLDVDPVVRFEGRDYTVEEAIPLLAGFATDRSTESKRRGMAASWLYAIARTGNPAVAAYVPDLVQTYLELDDTPNKVTLLLCISAAGDRATLGFYEHVLDHERDEGLRLRAADALAQWNARRGVHELIALVHSRTMLGERPLAAEAMARLFLWNRNRGWGAPFEPLMEEVRRTHDVGRGASPEQALAALAEKVEEWFAANKERFPEVPAAEKDAWLELAGAAAGPGQPLSEPDTAGSPSPALVEPTAQAGPDAQPTTTECGAATPRPQTRGVSDRTVRQPTEKSEPTSTTATVHVDERREAIRADPAPARAPVGSSPLADGSSRPFGTWILTGGVVLTGVITGVILGVRRRASSGHAGGKVGPGSRG